jgi:hypothetical protein
LSKPASLPWTKPPGLSSISKDGWKRHHRDKIIKLSPRRVGVKLADVLAIGGGS